MNDSLYLRTPRPYGMHSRNYKFMNGGAPLRHTSSLNQLLTQSVDSNFVADIPFERDDVMSSSYHSQPYYPNPHHFYHHHQQQHRPRDHQYYREELPPYHQFPQQQTYAPVNFGRREQTNPYHQLRDREPHPQQQQYYDNVYPYERPKKPTADEFLEKLRRHKAELQQRQTGACGGYDYQYEQAQPQRKAPAPIHQTVSESSLTIGAANDYVPKRLITPISSDVKVHSNYRNPHAVELLRRPSSVQFSSVTYDNVRDYMSPSPPLPRQKHSSYSGVAPAAPSPYHAQIQPAAIRRQGSLQNLVADIQNYSANSSECDYNEHWPKDPFETTRRFASPRNLPLSPPPVHHSSAVKVNGFHSNFPQVGRVPTPQGILAKNGHGEQPKTQKKVVFQCDADLVRRLSFEIGGEIASKAAASDKVPPSVQQYDGAVDEALKTFLGLCTKIGGDLSVMGDKVKEAFNMQRTFVWNAAGEKEPDMTGLQSRLKPLSGMIMEISEFCQANRASTVFNHLSAIKEGIQALGWVTVKPTPAPFIKDALESTMYYVNRVLKDYKDKDQTHVEFTKAWRDLLGGLQTYVRQVHTTGLVWNSSPGAAAPSSNAGSGAPPPPSGGAPPPPPPPLPANLFDDVKKTTKPAADSDKQALFAEINKGSAITSGLKKVTADMQTHKNPSLRQQSTVPAGKAEPKAASATAPKQEIVRPPRIELENGKQWNVEYFKDNKEIIVEVKDMKQTIYIYKCDNSVVQVKGKCNSITLDSCKKTSVVFDNLLSQVEVINCQSAQIQTLGHMPTLSIQKTDGCMVYLSKEAMNAEIITSKSSEMNVLVPHGEDGEFVEYPVPEQFKTVFDLSKKKLQTSVSDIV
ncbi:hypothetical protein QR680_018562 [Steinernema hermaphroditum]|uniref:C-CAP/cofactor C-like domain-containing protein n=1 Tax=Steinernema hermaphroditum TaxID=289476 RepID=A0AA39HIC9_9BILA|nr:hypothetical protein QR680_018562 [Steinernema hermaphroditum]